MINLETETLLAPKQVCRLVPGRSGKGVSLATCWRWMLKGHRGVKLESLLVGGVRYTSVEAFKRFLAQLNGGAKDHCERQADRAHATRRVEHALDAEGF